MDADDDGPVWMLVRYIKAYITVLHVTLTEVEGSASHGQVLLLNFKQVVVEL